MLNIKFCNGSTNRVFKEFRYACDAEGDAYEIVKKVASREAKAISKSTGQYLRAYEGLLAETIYKYHLHKQGIDYSHPGYKIENGENVADLGDVVLYDEDDNEVIIDIKTSSKYYNVAAKYRWDCQIDKVLGTHIKYDGFSAILYVYGFIDTKDMYKYDIGCSEYAMVLAPHAFKH